MGMRPTCTYCARKHLAQASVLLAEAHQGYPDHIWLAIGHLAEASEELLQVHPDMAREIRQHRKVLEEKAAAHERYDVPIMELIKKVGALSSDGIVRVGVVDNQDVTPMGVPKPPPGATEGTYIVKPTPNSRLFTPPPPPAPPPPAPPPPAPPPPVDTHLFVGPGLAPVQAPPPAARARFNMPKPEELAAIRAKAELDQKEGRLPPGRLVLKADGTMGVIPDKPASDASATPAAPPVEPPAPAPIPTGCTSCAEKSYLTQLITNLSKEQAHPNRLILLTTLGNFNPSYSLTSVVLEQAHAAALMGWRVWIMVHAGCDLKALPQLPPQITILPVVPQVPFQDDVVHEPSLPVLEGFLLRWLRPMGKCSIITHDLLFQKAFVTFARVIHSLADGSLPEASWYHLAHSSVGRRPDSADLIDRPHYWRHNLPKGHHLLVLNYSDQAAFLAYYGLQANEANRIKILLNPRDVRPFLRMSQTASMLTTKFNLHLADFTMLYPLAIDRVQEKGVLQVCQVLGALKRTGASIRLVLALAHANGDKAGPRMKWIEEAALSAGLTVEDGPESCREVILTPKVLPETAAYGLPADDVRSLWMVSNLFIFPTISEAGSLVLMEAALAGCQLVLNDSLPCLRDYISREQAIWVPWGSLKGPGVPVDLGVLADKIVGESTRGAQALRRIAMRRFSLEEYGLELNQILGAVPAA